MTPEEHKVCELEKQVAILGQEVKDADKALALANDIHRLWTGLIVAVVLGIIADGLTILVFLSRK